MSSVPGDPASLSACASTVSRVSVDLTARADGIRVAGDSLGEQWHGRTSAQIRHRGATLAGAADLTAHELGRVARVLQDHSSDLCDLIARARAVAEQAAAVGLEVREGRVVVAFGVAGTADPDRARDQNEARERLQRDLAMVLTQHRRRRDRVLEALKDSTAGLAGVSHGLRQG